jgi:DNA-binding transcriptional regulator YiaG
MSPAWLATGQGERHPFFYLPSSEDLGIGDNALFSEVFDTHLALGYRPKYASPVMQVMVDLKSPDQSSLRASLRDLVADSVAPWLDEIPDESLNAFIDTFLKLGKDALRGFKRERWEKVLQRRRHRWIVRQFKAKREAEAREATTARLEKREKECKEGLDTPPSTPHTSVVKVRIRSLRELVHRLKQVTSAPGAKAALARKLGVTRQAVGQWLSGKSNPTAEATLQLLNWVEEVEAEQNKTLAPR